MIDAFYDFGMDETNVIDYTEDGMHLDNEGRQDYAYFLAGELGML